MGEQLSDAIDPIWHNLRIERIWKFIALFFSLAMALLTLWRSDSENISFFSVLWLVLTLINIFSLRAYFKHELAWRDLANQRREAMQDTSLFITSPDQQPERNTHALPIPATIELTFPRTTLIIGSGITILAFMLLFVWLFVTGTDTEPNILFFLALGICGGILFLFILSYFRYLHYQTQTIFLTQEGLTTSYMRQKRTIRWDEALLFAVYPAQGLEWGKSSDTYELASEHTIVRWSAYSPLRNAGLHWIKLKSPTSEDNFQRLVSQLNQIVAARTELPLLHLAHSEATSREAEGKERAIFTLRQARKTLLRAGSGFFAIIIGFITYGLYQTFKQEDTYLATILLGLGGAFLLFFIILAALILIAWKPMNRMALQQRQAYDDPTPFLISDQPEANADALSLPVDIRIRSRKNWTSIVFLLIFMVIWLFTAIYILHLPSWITSLTTLIFCVMIVPSSFPFISWHKQVSETRLELTEEGIFSRENGKESFLRWQDARLFAISRPFWSPGDQGTTTYELIGDRNEVRWEWKRPKRWKYSIQPEMNRDEYNHFMANLLRLIAGRTGLPLLEFSARKKDEGHN